MALESATYLDDLNPAFPASTDLLAQGDDHIRLIKAVLQATFPNITGPVTVTQGDLNTAVAILASATGGLIPIGGITAWYGTSLAVPAGWHVCDGTTGIARSDGAGTIDVPDLRNQVIMGAGTVAPQGTTFGGATASATSAAAGAHSHATTAGEGGHTHSGTSVGGHALTVAELPAHKHLNGIADDLTRLFTRGTGPVASSTGYTVKDETGFSANYEGYTETVGSGSPHDHTIAWPATPDGVHTHTTDTVAAHAHGVTVSTYQPALALHYIMKV